MTKLDEKFQQANALHQQGQLAAAQDAYLRILDDHPQHFDALNMLGVLAGQMRDLTLAVQFFDRAIAVSPGNAAAYCNRGLALNGLRQFDAALDSFSLAIELKPDDAVAHFSQANIYKALGRNEQALASYDKAIEYSPGFAQAHFNRGVLRHQCQQLEPALTDYDQAIALKPDYAEAHGYKSGLLYQLNRFDEATSAYDRAIAVSPDNPALYLHRGNALKSAQRLEEALASYDAAIARKPDYAEAYSNRAIVLYVLNRVDDALASYGRAIEIKPDFAEAYFNRGSILHAIKEYERAVADFGIAGRLNPDIPFLFGSRVAASMHNCDWTNLDQDLGRLVQRIERGEPASHPFLILTLADSPHLQKRSAEIWVRDSCAQDDSLGAIPTGTPEPRIRIGYFSADYRDHPVARLVAELIEAHDRSRFEIVGYSIGPEPRDELGTRIARAFDRFHHVQGKSAAHIAGLVRSQHVHVAVDLGGHTHASRPTIFALRAAPAQINFLGYPGTMGAPYMDYIVADSTLIPPGGEQHFSEKVIYLPHTYQANDTKRLISSTTFTRQELGLPEDGFVFCCFNNNFKILPSVFAVWMRILRQTPGSVLWLLEDNDKAAGNLRQQASDAGIAAERLVFAPRMAPSDHLARHRAADLFLDTLPYNAHTTASDSLWAGLPILTCIGQSFPSRVAASLLKAIGLPELITSSLEEYERSAILLASSPPHLAEIRGKLARNRLTTPLFDIRLFTTHLEAAYAAIVKRVHAGLPPDHIHVRP